MDPIASCAERMLLRSPHPALRLSELLESVAESLDRTLDAQRLRGILEAHPDRFRILEPWRGPWRSLRSTPLARRSGMTEAWVVAVSEPAVPPGGRPSEVIKLRESVRWLARGIDARSPSDVSRWYAIVMSERAVRKTLARRAA